MNDKWIVWGPPLLTQPEPVRRGDAPLELTAAVLNTGSSHHGTVMFGWHAPHINGNSIVPKLFVEWEGKRAFEHPQAVGVAGMAGMFEGQTRVTITRLPPDTLIECWIESSDTGAMSNVVPLMIPQHPSAPRVVLRGEAGSPTTVSWTIVPGTGVSINSTVLHRFNPDDTITTFNPNVTFSASDHVVGETYYYAAYHVLGGSFQTNYGNLARVTIQRAANATDPTGLRITNATNGRADFAWNLNSAVGSVFFDYRVKGASAWTTVPLASGTTTHFLSGLAPFTEYEARVRVSDAGTNPTDTTRFYGNGTRTTDFA